MANTNTNRSNNAQGDGAQANHGQDANKQTTNAPVPAPAPAAPANGGQAKSESGHPMKLTGEELERVQKSEPKQEVAERVPEGPLQTEHGDTSIEDRVVEKIAEIAAREVPGVYAMGTSTQRTFSNIAGKISRSATAGPSGVSVKTGVVQASIALTIVVEYGFSIVEVADGIRANIIDRVGQMTGLDVVEVNIDVSDVHLPSDDDQEASDDAATQLR